MGQKTLIVILGPTGVGKSDISIALAQRLSAPIVSSDSRQIYRQMRIGTAVPTKEQLDAVNHYFIHSHNITDHYSVGDYEKEAMGLITELFKSNDNILLVGGSGLYIDAICKGIDEIPSCSDKTRSLFKERIEKGEFEDMVAELKESDPIYYETVDRSNRQRVTRALEVIHETGKPYSSFRTGMAKKRDFRIIKIGIDMPREILYDRINRRVDEMMNEGLLAEATSLYSFRDYNALQTVGYREIFDYLDGKCSLDVAIDLLKRNSRHYAKRQMTWFRRDSAIKWLTHAELQEYDLSHTE